ncbi:MAG: hypothetical protein LBG48_04100 [Rickettsiales bacterium]|jgi:hypothetical protein|nr:hypothetical protein [Rickettsiales bacterium]
MSFVKRKKSGVVAQGFSCVHSELVNNYVPTLSKTSLSSTRRNCKNYFGVWYSMPISLDNISITGPKFSIDNDIFISLEKLIIQGPFKANQIPDSSLFVLDNLAIKLPKRPQRPQSRDIRIIAELAGIAGQNNFNVSMRLNTN